MEATEIDENGNIWVEIAYEWMATKQKTDLGEIEYDSRDPSDENDPLASLWDVVIGNGFSMQISQSGELLEISGLDTFFARIVNESGIEDETYIAQLEAQYNEDALKEQFGNIVFEYPEGPVKIGDSWTLTIQSTSLAPLISENTYTLLAYEDGIATLEVTSIINTDPDQSEVDMGMYIMRYNLSGTQEGTIYVDTATGWTLSAAVTQTLSGEMTMIMGEEEITVPLSATSIVEIEIYEE